MINVLVVEDSRVIRDYLVHVLETDPDLRVMGAADSGEAALEFLSQPFNLLLRDLSCFFDVHDFTLRGGFLAGGNPPLASGECHGRVGVASAAGHSACPGVCNTARWKAPPPLPHEVRQKTA